LSTTAEPGRRTSTVGLGTRVQTMKADPPAEADSDKHTALVRLLLEQAAAFSNALHGKLRNLVPSFGRLCPESESLWAHQLVTWVLEFDPVDMVDDFLVAVWQALDEANEHAPHQQPKSVDAASALYLLGAARSLRLRGAAAGESIQVCAVPSNADILYALVAQAITRGMLKSVPGASPRFPGIHQVTIAAAGERTEAAVECALALEMDMLNEAALDRAQKAGELPDRIEARLRREGKVKGNAVAVVAHGLPSGVDGQPPVAARSLAARFGADWVSVQYTDATGGSSDVELIGVTIGKLKADYAEFWADIQALKPSGDAQAPKGGDPSMTRRGNTIINTQGGPVP
jgi:hypothetical protein